MPKRPCSVIITPDNQDILTADKFGDVYSIPLIQSPDWKPTTTITAPSDTSPAEAGAPSPSPSLSPSPAPTLAATATTGDVKPQYYKPQATELTVHTGRNRKALLDQQISASHAKVQGQGGTPRRVETAPFERYLLLGHVSLLTAVAYGFDDDDVDNIDNNENGRRMGRRPYILTADRDEHIRVSRGTRAQAHVIEQFCLGHVDFVNRLCIPSSSHGGNNNNNNDKHRNGNGNADPLGHLLVSAGGDPELFVWRWKEGRLLAKAPLLAAVQAVVPEATKVAVTGLCEWPFAMAAEQAEAKDGEKKETRTRMVAICERYVVPPPPLFPPSSLSIHGVFCLFCLALFRPSRTHKTKVASVRYALLLFLSTDNGVMKKSSNSQKTKLSPASPQSLSTTSMLPASWSLPSQLPSRESLSMWPSSTARTLSSPWT